MLIGQRPWWPPNVLRNQVWPQIKSATSIILVSMCIFPLTAILVASEAMVAPEATAASKQPQYLNGLSSAVKFNLRFVISNLNYPCISIQGHFASNSHFGGLWGHGGLQMSSGFKFDLGFEISNLHYPVINVYNSHFGGLSKSHNLVKMNLFLGK